MAALEQTKPIPMVLHCPKCSLQHVDEPDLRTGWMNPPHRSHECQNCGYTWRPCDLATEGVGSIKTSGQYDGKFNIKRVVERRNGS